MRIHLPTRQLYLLTLILIMLTACRPSTSVPADVEADTDSSEVAVESSPQRDTISVRILTLNTYMLPTYSKHLEARLPCIQEILSDYDILALQEVFDDQAQQRFVNAWYKLLGKTPTSIKLDKELLDQKVQVPENERPPDGEDAKIVHDTYFVFGPDQSDWDQDGGLLILSRYPILKSSGFVFDDCSGSDCAANKGALYARIKIGTTAQDYIHLFTTHTQSDEDEAETRDDQFRELQWFITAMTSDDRISNGPVEHPVILLGDLNVDGQSTNDEYKGLRTKLSDTADLIDLWLPSLTPDPQATSSLIDPGYSNVGNSYQVEDENLKKKFDEYVTYFWGSQGNVLASNEDQPRRYDYAFSWPGRETWMLNISSLYYVPQTSSDRSYCFEDPPDELGTISGDLAQWLSQKTASAERTFTIDSLTDQQDLDQAEKLKAQFEEWGFVIQDNAVFRRDGDDIDIFETGLEGSFELEPEGEGEQFLYEVSRDDMPTRTCRMVSQEEACAFRSQTPSDHLGLALEMVFSQPHQTSDVASSGVSPEAPEPVILPTSTIESQAPGAEYANELAALMQGVNERQAAIDFPLTDWGIQGDLHSALSQLQDPLPLAQLIEQGVRGLIGSSRFWNPEADACYKAAVDLFGPSGDQQLCVDMGCLEQLASALDDLDTVIFTAFGSGTLAKYPATGGIYPTWPPEEVAKWDIEGLWQGMVDNQLVVENQRGWIASRHLDHVHPYAWIIRSFLSFDTRSLSDAPGVSTARLRLLVEKAYSADYNVEDPDAVKEGPAQFEVDIYAGKWDPESGKGDGWGVGPSDWLYVEGTAQDSWDCCPLPAALLSVPEQVSQAYLTCNLDPGAVWADEVSQYKLQLADESYPGAPGVRNVLEDTFKLYGNLTDQLLLVELDFTPVH